MLKTIYSNCAGIDVHKKTIVVTIAKTNKENVTEYETKTFKTFTEDLIKCREWLVSNNTLDVCMESTGKYWIPVFNVLETDCKCVISHPKYVRSIPGKKTDKKDSKWIADIFKHGLVEPSFMPPKDIRDMRDLLRYRKKLVNNRTGEKNRFQNSLTVSNVQISSVVSDVFGVTAQSILKLMLSNPELTLEDIPPLLKVNLKSSLAEILKSIDGTFDDAQSSKMSICLSHFDSLNECIDTLEESVLKLAMKYTNQVNLLLTIPGISEISAITIISEIGVNMNAFVDDKHLASWAGLTPRCKESGGKKQSTKITHAGQYIKPLLVECAHCAIKDKSCPYIKAKFDTLKKKHGYKKAIIAIARFLLVCVYHILNSNEGFDYERYANITNKKKTKSSKKQLSEQDMIDKLTKLGYNITLQNT